MIAITVRDNTGETVRVPLFGQARKIALVDKEGKLNVVENPVDNGRALAQWMIEQSVNTVITGHISRNAWEVLTGGGAQVYYSELRNPEELIKALNAGELTQITEENSSEFVREPRHRNQGKH